MSGFPERSALIRRTASRLCRQLGWSALDEVPLPNGRRADLLALAADGSFICIEIKSGTRDFLTDAKWPDYREFSDALYFAVDLDFPIRILPETTGLIVSDGITAEIVRAAPDHRLAPSRRRALLHRYATLAADRLALLLDPASRAAAALLVE